MVKKKIGKIILISALTLLGLSLVTLVIMVGFSPYGNQEGREHKLIQETILINAPAKQVYAYLGVSSNASQWSVYVNHITPINNNLVPDGAEGSIRRCFVNKNEKGEIWDEKILLVELNQRRVLSCYNFLGFNLNADTLITEQLYQETTEGHCLLALTLTLPPRELTFLNELKMYFAAYKVSNIFEKNLENIKKLNEQKE